MRKRNPENRGLPTRWKLQHGAYYYRVPPGREAAWDGKQMFRLGDSLSEATVAFYGRVGWPEVETVAVLLDRYAMRVVPSKAPKTRSSNRESIARLSLVLGHLPISDGVKPRHVYQYVDRRSAKTSAHRDIEVLSHAFTKAVEWGLLDRHPFKGEVRLTGEKPRDRYIETWELDEILSIKPVRQRRDAVLVVQAYIRLKMLTGLRQGDLLRLRVSDWREDGLHCSTHKTSRTLIFEPTPALHGAIDRALAVRPNRRSDWLFCTGSGGAYMDESIGEARGWKSIWQRYKKRVLAETKVVVNFTEHDLRAKVASDAGSVERAQELLAHLDSRLTRRVYRRAPTRLKPAEPRWS